MIDSQLQSRFMYYSINMTHLSTSVSEQWFSANVLTTMTTRMASLDGRSWRLIPGLKIHVVCGSCRYQWPQAKIMPWIQARFSNGPWFSMGRRRRLTTNRWRRRTSTRSSTKSKGSTPLWKRPKVFNLLQSCRRYHLNWNK